MQHVPELMTSPARSRVARSARSTASVSVALLLLVLTVRLALGPIHAVQDAAGCERAGAIMGPAHATHRAAHAAQRTDPDECPVVRALSLDAVVLHRSA